MPPETEGQMLLPADPESLLKATRASIVARNSPIREYLALSYTRTAQGEVQIRLIRLDPTTRRVKPEHLDTISPEHAGSLSAAEYLRHWAAQLVLDSWDTPE